MSSSTLAVLHGVRLASVAGTESLAARSGLTSEALDAVLSECLERGWLRRTEGRLAGWSLTRAGRAEGERLLALQLDSAGCREGLEAVYGDFLPLNAEVLEVCTDWQVVRRDGRSSPNDHSDPGHDRSVLDRLADLHHRTRPLLERATALLERFGGYEPRLGAALHHTLAGRTEWFTRPTIDSYHTVWFELHEDLLATLGRRRSDEAPGRGARAPRPPALLEERR